MANKSSLGGVGFYATLSLCLLAVGLGGYFLLFREPAPAETVSSAVELPAEEEPVKLPAKTVPLPEVEVPAAEPPEVPVVSMPVIEVDDTPVMAEEPRLIVSPLKGETVAAFSMDELQYNETLDDWRTHDGIDIAAAPGTNVFAACAGTVASVTDDPLMGTTVVVDHDRDYRTVYANLQSKPPVKAGDTVTAGQILGAVGTTAAAESARVPHLHFSVTRFGAVVDPAEFLEQ